MRTIHLVYDGISVEIDANLICQGVLEYLAHELGVWRVHCVDEHGRTIPHKQLKQRLNCVRELHIMTMR